MKGDMTDDRLYQELREAAWRRKLTPEEESRFRTWLAAHPEAQADWELETALNDVMIRLPDAPVSSNFTARVLAAAEAATKDDERRRRPAWKRLSLWVRWLPRVAFAAVVLGVGLVSYHQVQNTRQAKMVESVTMVSELSSVPSPDALKDFEAIRALDRAPADEKLLQLLE